jgi:ADP-heptose:LPS heptosyltransferase
MEFLKPAELLLRRNVVKLLRVVVSRRKRLPEGFDFSDKKFLFVRQDRIGDVLVSTPLLLALKERYPAATVDFLLSANNHFVLANEPLVRQRWIYRKTLISAFEILRSVRRERYDFVIDLMDNPSATSTIFCALAGGRWNVGLSKDNEYAYDIVVPLLSRKETHIVDRLAMLLTVFGIQRSGAALRMRYNVLPESRSFASEFFERNGLGNLRTVGINISPGEGTRFWGRGHYQDLIRWIKRSFGEYRIVVLCRPSDASVARAIAEPFPDAVLSPETPTFDHFAALIQHLSILVTPDTSAVHLAAAFNIPSVVLFVQSNKDLRVWEPYGSLSESVITDIDDLETIPLEGVTRAFSRLAKAIDASETSRNQGLRSTAQ